MTFTPPHEFTVTELLQLLNNFDRTDLTCNTNGKIITSMHEMLKVYTENHEIIFLSNFQYVTIIHHDDGTATCRLGRIPLTQSQMEEEGIRTFRFCRIQEEK